MLNQTVPSFTLRLPPLSTRKVWIGCYSEMTGTVILIFDKKPKKCPILGDYGPNDPQYLGSIWIDDWEHWFGTVRPLAELGLIENRGERIGWIVTDESLDCRRVVQVELTMSWNEHGQPIGLNTNADN